MNTDESAEPPSIDLQIAAPGEYCPAEESLCLWAQTAAGSDLAAATIRIVTQEEIQALNRDFRHLDVPTNVLSFPSDLPEELDLPYLGDIAVCAEVVNREAEEQGKDTDAHWAHMVVHGMLHLCGYDHVDQADAAVMEALEIEILKRFGISDPYTLEPSNRVSHV